MPRNLKSDHNHSHQSGGLINHAAAQQTLTAMQRHIRPDDSDSHMRREIEKLRIPDPFSWPPPYHYGVLPGVPSTFPNA
jgi:hypothetical protein